MAPAGPPSLPSRRFRCTPHERCLRRAPFTDAGDVMLSPSERHFVLAGRVGHLATADRGGAPHVVPVCFGLIDDTLYIAIDEKPKRASARPLKRLRNITDNPSVAFVVDRYDEDWT